MSTDPQPVTDEQVAPVVIEAIEEVESPTIGEGDKARHRAAMAAQHERLAKEPKERIRVPKSAGPQTVIINGARFDIAANVPVEVPQTVARHLRQSGRI